MNATQEREWAGDPSPSYAAIGAMIGCGLPIPTSPTLPPNDVAACIQLFWPAVRQHQEGAR